MTKKTKKKLKGTIATTCGEHDTHHSVEFVDDLWVITLCDCAKDIDLSETYKFSDELLEAIAGTGGNMTRALNCAKQGRKLGLHRK